MLVNVQRDSPTIKVVQWGQPQSESENLNHQSSESSVLLLIQCITTFGGLCIRFDDGVDGHGSFLLHNDSNWKGPSIVGTSDSTQTVGNCFCFWFSVFVTVMTRRDVGWTYSQTKHLMLLFQRAVHFNSHLCLFWSWNKETETVVRLWSLSRTQNFSLGLPDRRFYDLPGFGQKAVWSGVSGISEKLGWHGEDQAEEKKCKQQVLCSEWDKLQSRVQIDSRCPTKWHMLSVTTQRLWAVWFTDTQFLSFFMLRHSTE